MTTIDDLRTGNDAWDSALTNYHSTRLAFAAYAAHSDWDDGPRYEELLNERTAAEFKLSATPAPNASALHWKIDHARELAEDMDGDWPDKWWADAMADLLRFTARA